MRVSVVGGGAWGTALASHCARAGLTVRMWVREPEVAAAITEERRNPEVLPGVELPAGLRAESALAEALDGAEMVLVVVPSEFSRSRRIVEALARRVRPPAVRMAFERGLLALMLWLPGFSTSPTTLTLIVSGAKVEPATASSSVSLSSSVREMLMPSPS